MTNIPKDTNLKFAEGVSKFSTVTTTQSAVTTLIETLPYFELAGYPLELQNHGAPQCPDISLDEEKGSRAIPQAWMHEINGQEFWFYNYPGVCAEAKFLGKEIPTIEQWIEMLASMPGNAEQKAQAINIPMIDCIDAADGLITDYDSGCAYLWSSSEGNNADAYCITLGHGDEKEDKYLEYRGHGMSLRFLSNQK